MGNYLMKDVLVPVCSSFLMYCYRECANCIYIFAGSEQLQNNTGR